MNICFFNLPECSSEAAIGGMERVAHLLAEELRRRGHHVEFHCEPPPRFCIPIVSGFLSSFLPSLFNRSAGTRFRRLLKEHKIDVAVWHKPGAGWSIPLPLKNLPCRLITLYHNIPNFSGQIYADHVIKKLKLRSQQAQCFVRCKPFIFFLKKYYDFCHNHSFSYAVRHSDKFVLLSERFIPEFAPAKKFPQKVCAIPNIAPFEAQNVDFLSKKKELLWLGRMDFSQKRPDYMLQIWQRLQDRFPDWSLRFVGDGPYLPELKTLATSLGMQRVSFEGHQDPAPYYRSASIYCMTSAHEGFGLTLVEAQAYGCVPVTFESYSAVHDIIEDGENGYLIRPFDLDAYAEKLSEMMSNYELRERLALNGRKSIAKFSAEAIGDKYAELLGGGAKKRRELLWVGRVVLPFKRPDFMLRIWQHLQDRFPDWCLRFVGDGDYLPELKRLSASMSLNNVSFEGYQDPISYYRSASIVCMTSVSEGFGLVLVEAQAYGCVPVAFDSYGAFRDIIEDGENGYLIRPFDLDAYAEKLAQLMQDSTLRERLARNGQKSIAKFSAEAVGDKWEKLLQELVR